MFRDGNQFYYHDSTSKTRSKKLSEQRRALEAEIQCRKHWLNIAKRNGFSADLIEKTEAKLALLEQELRSLDKPRTPQIKKTYKKLSLNQIKELVLKEVEIAKANGAIWLTVEDIAFKLNVKKHFVKQVFQQFNVEGILSQKHSRIPHDSNRDPMCYGSYSGWQSDIYYILNKDSRTS